MSKLWRRTRRAPSSSWQQTGKISGFSGACVQGGRLRPVASQVSPIIFEGSLHMTYRHLRLRAVALALRRAALFALVAVLMSMQILLAQRGQRQTTQAPPSNLPFDPHDISGIWRNPGGFDPILGMNRPEMTAWGKEKWSKTRASARNTPLAFGFYQDQKIGTILSSNATLQVSPAQRTTATTDSLSSITNSWSSSNAIAYGVTFGRTGASCRDLKQNRVGTDMRLLIGREILLSLNLPATMNEAGSIPTAPSTVTRCVSRNATGVWIMTIWNSA